MCAAYDPNGAIIVCGGGPRFWRPSNNCWQLVKVRNCLWTILDLRDKCLFRVSQEPGQKYLRCIQFMEQQQLSIGENSGFLPLPNGKVQCMKCQKILSNMGNAKIHFKQGGIHFLRRRDFGLFEPPSPLVDICR